MMRRRSIIIGLLSLAVAGHAAIAAMVTLPTPLNVEVYVKGDGKATPLRGRLTSYDETQFTLHIGQEDRTLGWADVTPASAYAMRQKTVDRTQAASWLELGKFAWSMGLKEQAKTAFKSAIKLDQSSQADADATMSTAPGGLLTATTRPAGNELMHAGSTPSAPATPPATPAATARPGDTAPTKYQAATPEEAAAAMDAYRKQAADVQKRLSLKFGEFETDHFLVFHDWDPREAGFLKENLENAYRVVARQFNMTPKENIFIGKLPVYMLRNYGEFSEFADKIDQFQVTNRTAGYYFGNNRGIGHMAMWKPDNTLTGTNNIKDAERLWAYVLVHEFTHAFLARYRSNEFIPRWLNEGVAEVIAAGEFPYPDHARIAHMMAVESKDLSFLFDSANRPTGEYYPVMQSMVEMLIRENKGNFLKLIDAIKDGEDPEAALQRLYNTDFAHFAKTWREWARRH